MIRNTAVIGLIVSHACPLKCNFCNHTREEVGRGRIGRAMMTDAILRFTKEADVVEFAFSGGDPFLYYDDIIAVLRTAREAGVRQPFHIVTSGYWSAPGETHRKLAALQGLGLRKLSVSYDTEHARWVTPEQIVEIGRVCQELGIRLGLYGTFWTPDESLRALLPDPDRWAAEVHDYHVYPAGRAAMLGRRPAHEIPEEAKYSCGRPSQYIMAIYPDGEVYPCCSGGFNKAGKLACGNIHHDGARAILDRAYGNFHVRMVKEFGWGALYDIVRREAPELVPELPKFEDVDSPCEICRDLNVKLPNKLAPIYAKIEAEYAATMAEFEWHALRDASPPEERRRFGHARVTLEELRTLLTEDLGTRRDYLTGRVWIEVDELAGA